MKYKAIYSIYTLVALSVGNPQFSPKANEVVDFAELEDKKPHSTKEFRKSKEQNVPAPAFEF